MSFRNVIPGKNMQPCLKTKDKRVASFVFSSFSPMQCYVYTSLSLVCEHLFVLEIGVILYTKLKTGWSSYARDIILLLAHNNYSKFQSGGGVDSGAFISHHYSH